VDIVCVYCYPYMYLFDLEFVITPVTIILFPGDTSVVFACEIDPPTTIPSWDVDGTPYRLDELFDGDLSGHSASGTNITVSTPVNGTKYQCVISQLPPALPMLSNPPAFLYIAGKWLVSPLMSNPYNAL